MLGTFGLKPVVRKIQACHCPHIGDGISKSDNTCENKTLELRLGLGDIQ
jgi:hypothetical protein